MISTKSYEFLIHFSEILMNSMTLTLFAISALFALLWVFAPLGTFRTFRRIDTDGVYELWQSLFALFATPACYAAQPTTPPYYAAQPTAPPHLLRRPTYYAAQPTKPCTLVWGCGFWNR